MGTCVLPSKYKIFEYWKDKAIADNFQVVTFDRAQATPAGTLPVVESLAFPECWACGEPWFLGREESTLKRLWNHNTGHLHHAHIIARQFGGTDQPDNLFLLCPSCHIASPDTRYPEDFFCWVLYNRKHFTYMDRYRKLLNTTAEMVGISAERIAAAMSMLPLNEICSLRQRSIGEMGMHGSQIVDSTMGFTMIRMLREKGLL